MNDGHQLRQLAMRLHHGSANALPDVRARMGAAGVHRHEQPALLPGMQRERGSPGGILRTAVRDEWRNLPLVQRDRRTLEVTWWRKRLSR